MGMLNKLQLNKLKYVHIHFKKRDYSRRYITFDAGEGVYKEAHGKSWVHEIELFRYLDKDYHPSWRAIGFLDDIDEFEIRDFTTLGT